MRQLDENTEIPIFIYKENDKEYNVIPGKFIEKYLSSYYYIKGIMNYQIDRENLKEGKDLFRIYNLKEYEKYYSYYTDIKNLKYDFFITEKAFNAYIERAKHCEEDRIKRIKEKYKHEETKLLLEEHRMDINTKIPVFTYKKQNKKYDVLPGIFAEKYLECGGIKSKIKTYSEVKELEEGKDFFKIDNLEKYKCFYKDYCNIDNYKYDYFLTKKAVNRYYKSNTSVFKRSERIELVNKAFDDVHGLLIEDLNGFDFLKFDGYEISNVIKILNRFLPEKSLLDETKFYKLLDSKFEVTSEIRNKIIEGTLVPTMNNYINKNALIYIIKSLESTGELIPKDFIEIVEHIIIDSEFRRVGPAIMRETHAYYIEKDNKYM